MKTVRHQPSNMSTIALISKMSIKTELSSKREETPSNLIIDYVLNRSLLIYIYINIESIKVKF